eukprot:TRINITY_DN16374_c0_g1_i1.p1 TRINITY_DN16374_c0_g1~~TRINITY_DN16374_c0_g1_i1.p1  ORF type:complete len:418 (-),score=50.09 TRINITY_DN16374_c0_g1_i1:32-1135(-)
MACANQADGRSTSVEMPVAPAAASGTSQSTASPTQVPEPIFSLSQMFREANPDGGLPKVRVVDVGAMILDDSEDVWRPLVRRGLCASVVGFEPHAEECARLNALCASSSARTDTESTAAEASCGVVKDALPTVTHESAKGNSASSSTSCSFRFLPWALGDGSEGIFRSCSAPMTSSMLEPNAALLCRFVQLEEVTTVVDRQVMQTKRLDDLLSEMPEERIDYLKLDVQGYELAVLKGAEKALKDVLVVHTEVEFVEMYEGQPLFAEVDQFMRKAGFVFHRFGPIEGRPMKPLYLKAAPLRPISQQLWADAIYVRDLWELRNHSKEQLLRLAVIMHEIYHSYDVVHHVLKQCKPELADRYLSLAYSIG